MHVHQYTANLDNNNPHDEITNESVKENLLQQPQINYNDANLLLTDKQISSLVNINVPGYVLHMYIHQLYNHIILKSTSLFRSSCFRYRFFVSQYF